MKPETAKQVIDLMAEIEDEKKKHKWISVKDKLPEEYRFEMSRDVLTIAGSKMRVRNYDYELNEWTGSNFITITHWMELPPPPHKINQAKDKLEKL